MNIQAIIVDLVHSGALDQIAEQTGARHFQIGDAARGALQLAHSEYSLDKIFEIAMASAGISPRIAQSVQPLLMPLMQRHFTELPPVTREKHDLRSGFWSAALRLACKAS